MKKLTVVFVSAMAFVLVILWFFIQFSKTSRQSVEEKGQSTSKKDSLGWKTLDSSMQDIYLSGFGDGFHDGAQAEILPSRTPNAKRTLLIHFFAPYLSNELNAATIDKVRSEMDLFYNNVRNAPVCFSDARNVTLLALSGRALTEVELDALRSEDAKDGCP